MSPEDRAREGIFLAFQYPVEIPGVSNMYFLKAALNTIRKHRGLEELDAMDFLNLVREKMKLMEMDQTLLNRPVNAGFSGGEKKRNEIFQMAVLEPQLAILDETDSGLDIDALKLVAARRERAARRRSASMIVVTHYQRLLNYIVPDYVHVLSDGRIVKSGGKELALELEESGYAGLGHRGRRGGGRQSMTAVAEQIGAVAGGVHAASRRPSRGCRQLREAAFQRFAELGFPTTHDEEWRFTNVAPIARAKFAHAAARCRRSRPAAPEAAAEHPRQSYASFRNNAFVALNTAFLNGTRCHSGSARRGDRTADRDRLHAAGRRPPTCHPRTLIVVGADAQCTIVESYSGTGRYFTNAVTEIVAGERAVVDHYKVQREDRRDAFHVATMQAQLGRSANFSTHSISLGGALVRNDVNAVLSEGTEATLNGLYIVNGTQHVDNHTVDRPRQAARHQPRAVQRHSRRQGSAPFSTAGSSSARTRRRPTPSRPTRTWCCPTTRSSTPSPSCRFSPTTCAARTAPPSANWTPNRCSTCSRAASAKSEARSLLTYAFAQDIIDRIKVPALRDSLERILFEKFHEHAQ